MRNNKQGTDPTLCKHHALRCCSHGLLACTRQDFGAPHSIDFFSGDVCIAGIIFTQMLVRDLMPHWQYQRPPSHPHSVRPSVSVVLGSALSKVAPPCIPLPDHRQRRVFSFSTRCFASTHTTLRAKQEALYSLSNPDAFVDLLLLVRDVDLVHHRVRVDRTMLIVTPSRRFTNCVFLQVLLLYTS